MKPTCIKCDGTVFELQPVSVKGSSFKLNFICCSKCGGTIGVLESHNTVALLDDLAKKLGVKLKI